MPPSIVAVMPCLGRTAQTVHIAERLLATADTTDWRLVCVVDDNSHELAQALLERDDIDVLLNSKRLGYWHSMSIGAQYVPDAPLTVILANDVLPGRAWLARTIGIYHGPKDYHP